MKEQDFVARRAQDWDKLQALLARGEVRLASLSGQEVRELVRLHRRVSADLAYVRTVGTNPRLIQFLNDLVARSAGVLYAHRRRGLAEGVSHLVREMAQAVRRQARWVWFAVLLEVVFSVFGWQVTLRDPSLTDVLVPPGFRESLEFWKEGTFSDLTATEGFAKTGFYVQNNTMATLFAAAGGMTFGLVSLYSMFINGVLMGVFLREVVAAGQLTHFLAGVLPHGVTESIGIYLGAAGGFVLAWAVIRPGEKTVGASLRAAGKDAALLIGLGIAMIWIAAPIEGWFSHQPAIPEAAKFAFAGFTLVIWLAYFLMAGREPS
ncbi:MAG: stage II sporulation protein M [Armatimonadetes bacterium]|nr:MAG: stage II sporulation protein M [Armatimonadota bacterium]